MLSIYHPQTLLFEGQVNLVGIYNVVAFPDGIEIPHQMLEQKA
jgi:hypothetical protein